MLQSLPRLIALGILQPAQANAIRGMIDSMLRALNSGTNRAGSGRGPMPPIDRFRALLDADPEFADFLEPLLGEDYVAQLVGGNEDDGPNAENASDLDPDSDNANTEEDPDHDES